jgi:hypothetical protein
VYDKHSASSELVHQGQRTQHQLGATDTHIAGALDITSPSIACFIRFSTTGIIRRDVGHIFFGVLVIRSSENMNIDWAAIQYRASVDSQS